jgi:hypothetical protein
MWKEVHSSSGYIYSRDLRDIYIQWGSARHLHTAGIYSTSTYSGDLLDIYIQRGSALHLYVKCVYDISRLSAVEADRCQVSSGKVSRLRRGLHRPHFDFLRAQHDDVGDSWHV